MRNTLVFAGSSCPQLTGKICENLGMAPAEAELSQFSNGETSVRILTSVREKDVFVVQSGSLNVNDTIMELLIMISACKGGSANKVTAVLPYFPYSRQSKKKSHRGAITARMVANLMHVAGVKHVITVDLHASQMQGFFKCPVDNLHAEPLIARWIRMNVANWREAVVVSKNAGGTKRVTSLADALKLNFGIVTTDRKRMGNNGNMTSSMIMSQFNDHDCLDGSPPMNGNRYGQLASLEDGSVRSSSRAPTESHGSPVQRATRQVNGNGNGIGIGNGLSNGNGNGNGPPIRTHNLNRSPYAQAVQQPSLQASPIDETIEDEQRENLGQGQDQDQDYNDDRAPVVTQGRLVQGHIVPDDYPSTAHSEAGGEDSLPPGDLEDPMTMSHASSYFVPESHALGGSGDAGNSSDEEDEKLKDPSLEHMITLVGDVKNRPVLIVDDMIDKPGSWIAAAETVVKRGRANKVYCMATHGVFGADCLEQLQACECIDRIIVTNSFPIPDRRAKAASKLVILDLSFLLSEAIRRNHYGESISPLFQHIPD